MIKHRKPLPLNPNGSYQAPLSRAVTKQYRPMAIWLAGKPFTHFLSLTPNAADYGGWRAPSDHHGMRLRRTIEVYLDRVSKDLYGRGINRRQLSAAVFFENKTRSRDPTFWHAHAMIQVADDYDEGRLHSKLSGSWFRLNGAASDLELKTFCERDGGILGVADYITKYDQICSIEPLFYSIPASS